MKVRLHYKAYLTGDATANYAKSFEGHHFYRRDINALMSDNSVSNEVYSTEETEITYYSDGEIILLDPETRSVIKTYSPLESRVPAIVGN